MLCNQLQGVSVYQGYSTDTPIIYKRIGCSVLIIQHELLGGSLYEGYNRLKSFVNIGGFAMRYYLYDDVVDEVPMSKNCWSIVYCNSDNESKEDIAKSINVLSDCFEGTFKPEDHTCINAGSSLLKSIKNYDMFLIRSSNSCSYIWQVGEQVKDMLGFSVPNTYWVRKIGMLIP